MASIQPAYGRCLQLCSWALIVLTGYGCGRAGDKRPVAVHSGTVIGNAQGWYDGAIGCFGDHGGTIVVLFGDRIIMANGAFPELEPIPDVFAICGDGVALIFSATKGAWTSQVWHYRNTARGTRAVWLGSDEGEGPVSTMVESVDRDAFDREWRKQYDPPRRHQTAASVSAKAR